MIVLVVYRGSYSLFCGRLIYCRDSVPAYNTIFYSSDHSIFLHFSAGHSTCDFANGNLLEACIFFNSGTFLGLRAYRWFSRDALRTVSTLTDGQTLSLISVAGTNGFLMLIFFIIRLIVCDTTDFLPLVSTLVSYTKAFLIIFAEQPNKLRKSLYVFPSDINFFYQTSGFFTTVLSSAHLKTK